MVDRFFDQRAEAQRKEAERAEVRAAIEALYKDASHFLRTEEPRMPKYPHDPLITRLGYSGVIEQEDKETGTIESMRYQVYVDGILPSSSNERSFFASGVGEIVFDVPEIGQRLVLIRQSPEGMLNFGIEIGERKSGFSSQREHVSPVDAISYIAGFGQLKEQYALAKASGSTNASALSSH